jgi:hypothetical protein
MKLSFAVLLLSSAAAFSPSYAGGKSSALHATVDKSTTKTLVPPAMSDTDIKGLYDSHVQKTYGYV